jgi:hypothetical protein
LGQKLEVFDANADLGIFLTLDPGSGMEKFGSGIRNTSTTDLVILNCTGNYLRMGEPSSPKCLLFSPLSLILHKHKELVFIQLPTWIRIQIRI